MKPVVLLLCAAVPEAGDKVEAILEQLIPTCVGNTFRQSLPRQPYRGLLQKIQRKLANIVTCGQKEQGLRRDAATIKRG